MIKSYSEENLIKDLKIRIIMSNYHGKLLNVYNIEKYNFYESSVVVYHNTAIITCYPDIKINTLIKTFTKNTNITVSNISFDKSLIIFKLKFTKEKFNLIEVIKKTKMINSKDIKINNIPFRIYNNGQFKVI